MQSERDGGLQFLINFGTRALDRIVDMSQICGRDKI